MTESSGGKGGTRTLDPGIMRAFSPSFAFLQQFSNLPIATLETLEYPAFREQHPRLPTAIDRYRCILYLRL